MKRMVRKFALWLECCTSRWILPPSVISSIEDGNPEAVAAVKRAEQFWGVKEPELLKARARISAVTHFAGIMLDDACRSSACEDPEHINLGIGA